MNRIVEEYEKQRGKQYSRTAWCFNNMFAFLRFCRENKLTPENTDTYYENGLMYIIRNGI